MSWSEVVHENRMQAELQRARQELRLRRRGYSVEEKPCAGIPAVLSLAGVLTAAAWWRKEGRKPHERDWKSLPGISHLLSFLQSTNQPKRTPATRSSKAKPRTQLAPPSKAAAARQASAAGKPGWAGPARVSSSSSGGGGGLGGPPSAAAAAAAAAIARSGGGGAGSNGGGGGLQPQAAATTSSGSGGQQSKPKKKKNKKKK